MTDDSSAVTKRVAIIVVCSHVYSEERYFLAPVVSIAYA